MTVTSNKKRPADFSSDDEPDLKRMHRDGTMSKVSDNGPCRMMMLVLIDYTAVSW